MKKSLLTILPLLLFVSGCVKNNYTAPIAPVNPQDPQLIPVIDPELAAHFFFKKGSYWIYKDSISGRLDSFYVTNIDTSNNHYNITYSGPYARIFIQQQNIDLSAPSDSLLWVCSLTGVATMLDCYRGNSIYGRLEYHYMPHFECPLTAMAPTSIFVVQFDTISSYYAGEQINPELAGDSVFVYTHRTDPADTNIIDWQNGTYGTYLKDDFFVQKNKGLVKMRIYHPYHSMNYVWELVRSHIVL